MSDVDNKDNLELHPWLKNFDKKQGNEKIDILKERVKELDNLVGTASVIIICIVLMCVCMMALIVGQAALDFVGIAKSSLRM